jgi:NADH dehydrogenase [ubiquinone] 1 alpha subcomplex assembly factor 1
MTFPTVFRGFLSSQVLLACCLVVMTGSVRADATSSLLFGFDTERDTQHWISVNDSVMGGRSDGAFRIQEAGVLEFYGNLSLENRGGFASIRSRKANLDVADVDSLTLRVRGDGRTYYLSVYVPTNRMAYSYRAKFDTEAGRWQEIRLPLKAFQATWFGRKQPNAPEINGADIRSLGFTLADKKAGPFKLDVDWIGAASNAAFAP